MKISLCMIVKNESKNIDKCLKSVVDFVDEIIIVDTGSTDNTIEISKKYTDKIFNFPWCDDFSKARNYSLSKASNKIVLILDADEIIESFSLVTSDFKSIIEGRSVGRVKRINPFEDESGIKKYIERVNRVFNKEIFEYQGIIHEQVVKKDGSNYETINVDIDLNHIGYMDEIVNSTGKLNRNISLLNKTLEENGDDPYIYYQLGKSYYKSKMYREALFNFEKCIDSEDNLSYEYMLDAIESYGYSLINSKKYNKALALLKYNGIFSRKASYNFLLGIIYMNNAMFSDAIDSFKKCTTLKYESIEGITRWLPNYNIGVIYEVLGDMNNAFKYYKKSSEYKLSGDRLKALGINSGELMSNESNISLCMIVKDEEKYIEGAIKSALALVDEIIIVDTGSKDRTIEIIESLKLDKIKIFSYKWENDFSKARNFSLSKAEKKWILVMDADEDISYNRDKMLDIIDNSSLDAYTIPIYNILDDAVKVKTEVMLRLFKREDALYKGAIHEQLHIKGAICQNYEVISDDVCKIDHYGYTSDVMSDKDKYERNINLINEEIKSNPKNGFNYYNLGVTYSAKGDHENALRAFKKALKFADETLVYYENLVLTMMRSMYLSEDIKALEKLLNKFKYSKKFIIHPTYYFYWGKLYTMKGDYDRSIKSYKKAASLKGDGVRYMTHGMNTFIPKIEVARIFEIKKDIPNAIEYYMEAIFDTTNKSMKGIEDLVRVLNENSMYDLLSELERILQEKTGQKYNLVDEDKKSKLKASDQIPEEENKKKYQDNKGEIENKKSLIEDSINKGDIIEATRLIKSIYDYRLYDSAIYSMMGIIYMLDGKLDKSKDVLLEGFENFSKDINLIYNIAFLYEQLEDYGSSLKYYKKITELDGEDKEVEFKIKEIENLI